MRSYVRKGQATERDLEKRGLLLPKGTGGTKVEVGHDAFLKGSKVKGKAAKLSLNEWLDEVNRLRDSHSDPHYYNSDRLGTPKFDNGIDKLCFERGMSPQEALDWWRAA
jgi:hypothetical protein